MIAKAGSLVKGDNPRFVVTNLPKQHVGSIHSVYEKLYCARGDIENRNKQQQLCLFADPHQLFEDARQSSVSAIFFLVGICADAGLAVVGIERYAVRQRTTLDAAGETFENRCPGGCQRPPSVVFMV